MCRMTVIAQYRMAIQVYNADVSIGIVKCKEIPTTLRVPTSSSDGELSCETISEMKFAAMPMQPRRLIT